VGSSRRAVAQEIMVDEEMAIITSFKQPAPPAAKSDVTAAPAKAPAAPTKKPY